MREALFITCLVLTASLSGCFGEQETEEIEVEQGFYPDIYSRHTLDWNWTDSYSYVLQPGPHTALEVQEATITVDTATLDGSTTSYPMSITPEHERNVLVFIEGVFQKHSTYSVSGSTITVSVTGADAGKVLTMLHGFDIV